MSIPSGTGVDSDIAEREIDAAAAALLKDIGIPLVVATRLRMGGRLAGEKRYEIDALASDYQSIVVVEFKSEMDKGVIGQLLTYCHVVEETAKARGVLLPVRGVIASPVIDPNWLAVAKKLAPVMRIDIHAVVRVEGRLKLRDAEEGLSRNPAGSLADRLRLAEHLGAIADDVARRDGRDGLMEALHP